MLGVTGHPQALSTLPIHISVQQEVLSKKLCGQKIHFLTDTSDYDQHRRAI